MDSDTLIILLIIAVFAVYMGVFSKTHEAFEQQEKEQQEKEQQEQQQEKEQQQQKEQQKEQQEQQQEQQKGKQPQTPIAASSGDFSPVEQDDTPPCYIVKSVYDKDNAKHIQAANYEVFEKEANFDSEYTNLTDYFGTNAKKINQKKYYDTITSADITRCGAPILEQAEYSTSAF